MQHRYRTSKPGSGLEELIFIRCLAFCVCMLYILMYVQCALFICKGSKVVKEVGISTSNGFALKLIISTILKHCSYGNIIVFLSKHILLWCCFFQKPRSILTRAGARVDASVGSRVGDFRLRVSGKWRGQFFCGIFTNKKAAHDQSFLLIGRDL